MVWLPAKPRQIMYAARPLVLEITSGKIWGGADYFTQILLPRYLEDFPDRLIGLYGDVTSADRAVVARTRAKAEQFFPGMRQIRKTFTLNDPEPWIEEIAASRKP